MSLKRFSATVLCVFAALLLQVSPVSGQTLKGTILGTVTDATHAVIPGVAVNIIEVNTNFRRTETSNDSGFFAFANLDPGAYRIEVEHTGFRKIIRPGIALDANTTVRIYLELAPGDVTQTVGVSSEGSSLQTDRADTGGKIESQQLDTLPMMNNRNYQNTIMLVPGAAAGYRSNSPFFNSHESLQAPLNGLYRLKNCMLAALASNTSPYDSL